MSFRSQPSFFNLLKIFQHLELFFLTYFLRLIVCFQFFIVSDLLHLIRFINNIQSMIYNKKELLNQLACVHCQQKIKPYLQSKTINNSPKRPNIYNYQNSKNCYQRQCCFRRSNKNLANLRVATQEYEKTASKQFVKSKKKLDPISKKRQFQQPFERKEQDEAEQTSHKLKVFLQNHDKLIKQWQERQIIDKQDFLHKIQRSIERKGKSWKGKSFSLKKKTSPSKSLKDLTVKKMRNFQSIPNHLSKEGKRLSFLPGSTEINIKKRLQTIQSQMYKEHLLNLLEINDRNQKQYQKKKKKIIEQVTQAEEKRISEQKKRLRKLQKRFQNILKQKSQEKYYEQLSYYQNLDLSPKNIQKLKEYKEALPKELSLAKREETPLPISHNKTVQNFNPQITKSSIPIYIQQQPIIESQSAKDLQNNQKTTLKSSKLTSKVVNFDQKPTIIPSVPQKSDKLSLE